MPSNCGGSGVRYFLFICLVTLSQSTFGYENVPQARPDLYGSSENLNCPMQVIPNRAIGPIELGRSLDEIKSLGMKIKTVQGSKTDLVVGRFSVVLNDSNKVIKVAALTADLPDCLSYQGKKLNKRMNSKQLAHVFAHCEEEAPGYEGVTFQCNGITIESGSKAAHLKSPELKITAREAKASIQ